MRQKTMRFSSSALSRAGGFEAAIEIALRAGMYGQVAVEEQSFGHLGAE